LILHFGVKTLWISAAVALTGCAAVDWESFKAPDSSVFAPKSVAALRDTTLKPVTAEDLVDAGGNCAAPFASASAASGQPASAGAPPPLSAGVGLDMTECEVVKRLGPPERVEIGTNERSERTLTMTYTRGSRPGLYQFVSGRLNTMERGPEPEPPPKPARKPAPKPKQPRTAT
jgi:hypothetical protein